ncbi:MAG: helix-turn-helix transcriptional regulator [Solirubrobacterales bacterium]
MEAGLSVARQFGENLRRERKRADLSQEEVGFRASLHRTEIGLLERGARTPRVDTLIKLANGLGIRIDCALLDGITWTPGATQAGEFTVKSRVERHREAMKLAAEARAGQKPSDAVQLVREGREELAQRTERWKEVGVDDES